MSDQEARCSAAQNKATSSDIRAAAIPTETPRTAASGGGDTAAYPVSQKCGLWGCGKSATTPVTILHPEAGVKEIVVCDYHSMMVRDAR